MEEFEATLLAILGQTITTSPPKASMRSVPSFDECKCHVQPHGNNFILKQRFVPIHSKKNKKKTAELRAGFEPVTFRSQARRSTVRSPTWWSSVQNLGYRCESRKFVLVQNLIEKFEASLLAILGQTITTSPPKARARIKHFATVHE